MPVGDTETVIPTDAGVAVVRWVWGWSARTGHITLGTESFPLRKVEVGVPICCYVNTILEEGLRRKKKRREKRREALGVNYSSSVKCICQPLNIRYQARHCRSYKGKREGERKSQEVGTEISR